MKTKIRIIVADDHPAFREGLCRILNDEEDLEVIGTCENGAEAVKLTREKKPHVAIIDINMPGLNGIEAAKQIRILNPDIAVLMLSAFDYRTYVTSSIKAGASGYILKTIPINELISSIRLVYSGKTVFDHKNVNEIFEQMDETGHLKHHGKRILEHREWEIITLVASGMSNKTIAIKLGISESTVNTHLSNVYRKLGVDTRTKAVLHCLNEGWLTMQDIGLNQNT